MPASIIVSLGPVQVFLMTLLDLFKESWQEKTQRLESCLGERNSRSRVMSPSTSSQSSLGFKAVAHSFETPGNVGRKRYS